jgi:secreted Zn-dependent insulinase-like peptidase
MKKKEISEFEVLQGQLESFHQELTALAKKNPNDALNKFKLGLVNSLLQGANTFLGNTQKPFKDFEKFDEAALPSNSDVLVVLAQYLSALEKLRADNIQMWRGVWYWRTDEDKSGDPTIRTGPPKKLREE